MPCFGEGLFIVFSSFFFLPEIEEFLVELFPNICFIYLVLHFYQQVISRGIEKQKKQGH